MTAAACLASHMMPPSPSPLLPQNAGFQMMRPRPAKPSSKPAAPKATPAPAEAAEAEPIKDVVEASAVIEPVSPQRLLAGTELETAPERRGRPVPVIKAGMAAPTPVQPSAGAVVAAPQSAPKPVAVVKPQKRATIGDMLRASQEGGSAGDGVYEPPYNGGGYAAVPTRPVPAQQQPASYPAPAPAGAYPVQTGSRAAAAAAAAEQAADPASSAVVPVQYNSDGSVVLAAKPIKVGSVCRAMYGADGLGWCGLVDWLGASQAAAKHVVLWRVRQTPRRLTLPLSHTLPLTLCLSLCQPPWAPPAPQLVKPAHLLPKTYGFEQFGSEEPLPPEAVEPEPYHASTDREQLGDDVFGGYRRSGRY